MLRERVSKERLFHWWRDGAPDQDDYQNDFAAKLRIIRDDGWVSLELVLVNNASMTVWVEEGIVVLAELDAIWQTSISTGQARHEIRQRIGVKDSLSVSLARAVYDASGRPQGTYSCLISTEVRFRFGEEWFSRSLDTYKIRMAALTLLELRRLRWYEKR